MANIHACTECSRELHLSDVALADLLKRWKGKCPTCAGSSIALTNERREMMTPHEAVEKAIKETIRNDGDVPYYLADAAIEALREGADTRLYEILAQFMNIDGEGFKPFPTDEYEQGSLMDEIIDAVLGPKESE